MACSKLRIKEVRRPHPIAVVAPTDFEVERAAEISCEEVARDPRFSLYCFDIAKRLAFFVELADSAAADRAAFYYQGQVEQAVGVVTMPLETFHAAAKHISKPEQLVLIHSVGRCGSTLLSKAFAAIPEVHSLSEPDDLTQLLRSYVTGEVDPATARALLRSSIRWRGKARLGAPFKTLAVKTRSEVLVLADLIAKDFVSAKHLFLYRDGLAWMRTLFRSFPEDREIYDDEKNRQMAEQWSKTLPMVSEYQREDSPLNPVELRILAWITCMEGCLRLMDLGINVLALRYEDLADRPLAILEKVFSFCGIVGYDRSAIEEVLGRDSQQGTLYDRELRKHHQRQLTPGLEADVRRAIATRPRLLAPEVVLPNTVA